MKNEDIIINWLLNSPDGRKIIKKIKNEKELKTQVIEYIVKNNIIATPMGSVKDIKTIRDWEHIYKNSKFSYKDGGSTSLGVVTIKFDNPKYNYTTNVSSSTTEAEARKFFVGKMFNVGSYPKENMQRVIDIDFSKSNDKYAKGGGVDFYEQLAVYVQGVGSIYNGTSMKKAIEKANSYLKKNPKAEIVISDEKYGDTYDLNGNTIEEDEMANGGSTKGFNYSIGGL